MNNINLQDVLTFNKELYKFKDNKQKVISLLNTYSLKDNFFSSLLNDINSNNWTEIYDLCEAPSFKTIEMNITKVFHYKIKYDDTEIIIEFEDIYEISGGDNGETFSLIENQINSEFENNNIYISGFTENSISCPLKSEKNANKILKKMNFLKRKNIFK